MSNCILSKSQVKAIIEGLGTQKQQQQQQVYFKLNIAYKACARN